MKRDRQSISTRHAEMLSVIRGREEIRVEELSALFGVSLMTVRRDLQLLEEQGKISRFHGGAAVEKRVPASGGRSDVNEARQAIARRAAALLRGGERIFINGSNTALAILNYLAGKPATVFTTNGLAVGCKCPANVDLVLLGGQLRGRNHVMTGDYTMRNLLMTQADIAFLGCDGISPDGEILCGIPTELGINETMIAHAEAYYILADYTKIGKSGTYASFSLEKAGCLITDDRAPEQVLSRIRAAGLNVLVAQKGGGEPVRDAAVLPVEEPQSESPLILS